MNLSRSLRRHPWLSAAVGIVAVAGLLALFVGRVLAVDLLGGDGDFDSDSQWSQWTQAPGAGVTITRDTAAFEGGTAAARLSGTTDGQAATLTGCLAHSVQVSKPTNSLVLTAAYRKDLGGTPTAARLYYELWDGGTCLQAGSLDETAATAPWSQPQATPLSGLNLQAGTTYTLRLGFEVTYAAGDPAAATAWFDSVTLMRDLEPPAVSLIAPSPAAGSNQNQASLTFSWQGTDNVTPAGELAYAYSTDGGAAWTALAPGQTEVTVPYAEGPGRTFTVKATDAAGNEGTDQRSFTVDLHEPAVTIQSGLGDGGLSRSATQAFTWSGLDNISAPDSLLYRYSVDGGATWSAPSAATQATVTYVEGAARTFDVRAIDQAGNHGQTGRSFTIDLTGPTVQPLSGPDGGLYVNQASQSFSWAGSDNFASADALQYQYSADGGATWSAWSSTASATATFAQGAAGFRVHGRDAAGNEGPALVYSFNVDLTPPAITSVTVTPGITDAAVTFATAGDPATGRLRYGTVSGYPAATAVEAGPAESHSIALSGLQPNTTYYYVLEATDRAGNVATLAQATFGTQPDNVPPDTQITGGPADGSWQNGSALTFEFGGSDNVTTAGDLRYSYSLDGGSTWSTPELGGSVQIISYTEGIGRTFLVRAVDEAGNADPTPAQRTFNIDRTAPALSLPTGPADGAFVTTTTPQFVWSGADAMTDAANLTYAISVDGGHTWSAWDGANTAQPTYAEGKRRSFAVRARDQAGNVSAVLERTFSIDVTAPGVSITSGLADGVVTKVSQQTFTWAGSDNVSVASALQYSTSIDGGVTWSPWGTATQAAFALPDGRDLSVQVRARDEAGQVSAAAVRRFTVDTQAPVIADVGLSPLATHADLTWNTTGDPSTSVVRWGTQPHLYTASLTDSEAKEAHSLTLSGLQPGATYYYIIEATDPAGNVAVSSEASFVTPAPYPHVISTLPETGDPSAGTGVQVKAYFDVDLDPTTVGAATFSLVNATTGLTVAITSVTYDAAARAAVLIPAAGLEKTTGYQARITTGIVSTEGQHLQADYAWTFTTGSTVFSSPHGNFTNNNAACKSCHDTHSSPAAALLSREDVSSLCFTCHDGTGSSYDVKGQFTGAASGSLHPVKNVPVVSKSLLSCTDCHNAHGDKQQDGSLYPRLLRVGQAGGGFAFSGNGVCLACHGATDRQFDATYYAGTGGDHSSSTAAHYQNFASLIPASGTGITCVACHKSHASPGPDLLQQANPEVCLSCHNNPANSQSGRNIQAEFQGATSRHDVYGTGGAALACYSCHGPHTVGQGSLANGDAHTELSNPQNTKQDMAAATTGTTAARRYTDFCLSCHNGSPPVQTATTAAVVPLTIVYPARMVTTNAGGGGTDAAQRTWNKSNYVGSAHYQAGLGCNDCHGSHGSPYDQLQSRPEDTVADGAAGSCGRCHSGNPPAQFATAPDVWPELSRGDDAHSHPTLTVSGQHGDAEDLAATGRHAECVDCHDPHTATAAKPALNVSGVEPAWGAAWTAAAGYTLKNPAENSYQVCLKCHSSNAFGTTPPTPSGGIAATDVAKEINPANASSHSPTGARQLPTFTDNGITYFYGKFVGSWTAASAVTCQECHGGTGTDASVHGSANAGVLKRPFVPGGSAAGATGTTGTSDHLCFACHDYNFYAGGDPGSATVRSQFSASNDYNLHASSRHMSQGCTSCHVAVPHGWNTRSLVADVNTSPGSPAPYFNGSVLRVDTWVAPETWQKADCSGCHGTGGGGGGK